METLILRFERARARMYCFLVDRRALRMDLSEYQRQCRGSGQLATETEAWGAPAANAAYSRIYRVSFLPKVLLVVLGFHVPGLALLVVGLVLGWGAPSAILLALTSLVLIGYVHWGTMKHRLEVSPPGNGVRSTFIDGRFARRHLMGMPVPTLRGIRRRAEQEGRSTSPRHLSMAPEAVKRLERILAQESPRTRESFDVFFEEFEGSLEDLLKVARSL